MTTILEGSKSEPFQGHIKYLSEYLVNLVQLLFHYLLDISLPTSSNISAFVPELPGL